MIVLDSWLEILVVDLKIHTVLTLPVLKLLKLHQREGITEPEDYIHNFEDNFLKDNYESVATQTETSSASLLIDENKSGLSG